MNRANRAFVKCSARTVRSKRESEMIMVGNGLSWAFALMAPFVGTLLIILSVTNALEWSTAGRTFAVVASLIMIPIGLFAWWYQYFDGAQKMRDFEEEFERL